MIGLYVFIASVALILGAALPLLRKEKPPQPPKDGWRKIDEE